MSEAVEKTEQIETTSFLENFYGTVFEPKVTFDRLKENQPIGQSLSIVLLIGCIKPLVDFWTNANIPMLGVSLFFSAVGSVISWLVLAFFFNLLSSAFTGKTLFREFLSLSAFALLPWIFIGPVELLKTAGDAGHLFGSLLGMAVWVWTLSLLVLAVMKTYSMSVSRAIMIFMIPIIAEIVAFGWIVSFVSTLAGIFN